MSLWFRFWLLFFIGYPVEDHPTTTISLRQEWSDLQLPDVEDPQSSLSNLSGLPLSSVYSCFAFLAFLRANGSSGVATATPLFWYGTSVSQMDALLTLPSLQVYAFLLACMNVFSAAKDALVYSRHLSVVTFTIFAVYAYTDIWPLMTFTLKPDDNAEGGILWARVALAALSGVVEPLLEPYPNLHLDAKVSLNDCETPTIQWLTFLEELTRSPNPEETASIFSFLLYVFLDPMVWRAYRVPHLSYDQIPPLPYYDEVKHLIQESYSVSGRTLPTLQFCAS